MQKSPPGKRFDLLPLAFAATLLLSALLLFSVQPLVGKLLLPLLGGAPAVWNAVMLFFQAMLLAGYAYAHWSFRFLGLRFQPPVHLLLVLAATLAVPFAIRGTPAGNPSTWVLLALLTAIGLPVFALAATAPLLQKWFASTEHPDAADPYFLYAASNAGSFAALFAYPLLVEPSFRLREQIEYWSSGFYLLAAAILCCLVLLRKIPKRSAGSERPARIPARTVAKWIALAFVPSSLMLGVTSYITTDVASIPLLWVLPLALYLLTFVIAFGRRAERAYALGARAIPIAALAVVFPMLVQATEPVFLIVALHLAFFFAAALQSHLKLARSRPAPAQLTNFYLCLSVGGVLGGIFNALIAPVLFNSVLEYPLLILAATLIGFPERASRERKSRLPPIYGGALVLLVTSVGAALIALIAGSNVILANALAGLFLIGTYVLVRTPIRYTVALASLLVCASIFRQAQGRIIERDRNFFGILRVIDERGSQLRKLYHGTTIHGAQSLIAGRECEPLTYYHRSGPVAEIFRLFELSNLPPNIGLVGLGAGAMLTYSKPGQNWTIYEIDPAVVRVAQDTNFFRYLSDCTAAPFQVELGDARLRLRQAGNASYGLLIVDAFSSDVIPMHLLTLEALQLYRQKLAPNGILAFHLSSRNFELEPLVAKMGDKLGLYCFSSAKSGLTAAAVSEGGLESDWAILVSPPLLHRVVGAATWQRVAVEEKAPLWTDDFSSLLGVLRLH